MQVHGHWSCLRREERHVHRGQLQTLARTAHDRRQVALWIIAADSDHRQMRSGCIQRFWRGALKGHGVLAVGPDTGGRLKSGLRLKGVRQAHCIRQESLKTKDSASSHQRPLSRSWEQLSRAPRPCKMEEPDVTETTGEFDQEIKDCVAESRRVLRRDSLREPLRVWLRVCPHVERECCAIALGDQLTNAIARRCACRLPTPVLL